MDLPAYETIAQPRPERSTRLAWLALVCGALALCLIALPMQFLAAGQPKDIKLSDEIRDLAREVVGKPPLNPRPEPPIQKWLPQLNAAGMTLAVIAVIGGTFAWVRREDWRIAWGGIGLATIAMTIHFYLLALGVLLVIAVVFFASTFGG